MYALLAVWGLRLGFPLGEEAPLRGSEAHDNTSLETGAAHRPSFLRLAGIWRPAFDRYGLEHRAGSHRHMEAHGGTWRHMEAHNFHRA